MSTELVNNLTIPADRLTAINKVLSDPRQQVIYDFYQVVEKYGTPEEINRKAEAAGRLNSLLEKVRLTRPEYVQDIEWLADAQAQGKFITESEYRRSVLGPAADELPFRDDCAVTLEISACQYFPWVIQTARRAVARGELMPGRFIRVRKMKEQELDGDLPATHAAMKIMGASVVETLDTKGTDGSNIHLGGPDTITGYFGGVGQPNRHALGWLDEFLYYYTNYGVRQVLNLNPGTVLLGYLLYQIGVDIEFKISVFMGNDNPYAALWTLIGARMFSREDGSSPLIGFNWSNSINNETMETTSQFRRGLGLEENVRFEHHITETWKSIVIQPYDRRAELIDIADHVPNISAKHEGGNPATERARRRPSDILDYFRDKDEVLASGDWDCLADNFMDKFAAVNHTAWELTENGLSFRAARNLHHTSPAGDPGLK